MSEGDDFLLQQIGIIQQHYDHLLEQVYILQNYTNEVQELLNEVLFNLGQNFRLLIYVEWIVILIDGFRDDQDVGLDVEEGTVTDDEECDVTDTAGEGTVTDVEECDVTDTAGEGTVTDDEECDATDCEENVDAYGTFNYGFIEMWYFFLIK